MADATRSISQPFTERFWSRVDRRGPDECWEWTAGRFTDGYGSIKRDGISRRTHVESYVMHYGPVPPGMLVRHTCDNPPCVNPAHLVPGTNSDNMADMKRRRRSTFGERSHSARLTESDVRAILRDQRDALTISREYGVSRSAIYDIRLGRRWKHVSRP